MCHQVSPILEGQARLAQFDNVYSGHLDSESRPTLILCTTTMKDRLFLRLSKLTGWSEMVYPQAAVLEAPLDSMSCTPNNITHLICHALPITSSTHPLILRHGLMNLQKNAYSTFLFWETSKCLHSLKVPSQLPRKGFVVSSICKRLTNFTK